MLRGMVQKGRMPHAVLFSEQSGCGALPLVLATVQFMFCRARKALAGGDEKWLLKGLFGDNPETAAPTTDSCEICSSCIKIRNLSHPDFHFVFPINTTQIVEKGKKAPIDSYYEIFRDLVKKNPYFSEQDLYNAMELDNKYMGSQKMMNRWMGIQQLTMTLSQMTNAGGNMISEMVRAKSTMEGVEQTQHNEQLDQIKDLFQQAETVVQAIVQLMQAVLSAENESLMEAIRA